MIQSQRPIKAGESGLASLLPFAIVLTVWFVAATWGSVPEVFLPSPQSVFQSLVAGLASGSLLLDLAVSTARIFAGFIISFLIALPLGVALALHGPTRRLLQPLNDFVRYVPVPAMVPLMILWLGLGNTSQIGVIVFGTLPQLIVLIADAASRLPTSTIELCQSLRLGRFETLVHAVLPYSSPQIYDGSRVAIGWAWSYLLVAEIVGATHGLGQSLITAQRFLEIPRVLAIILLIAVVGLVIDYVLRRLYPRLFPWMNEVRQAS